MEKLNLYDDSDTERFNLSELTKKITFEFRVNTDSQDRFLYLVNVLSSVEFKVDVDIDNIWIKEYDGVSIFRIKASGEGKNLNVWSNSLKTVTEFLHGDTGITYLKNTVKREQRQE